MADYRATCRSNYFRVTCLKSFEHWAWFSGLAVWYGDNGKVAITSADSFGWPTERSEPEADDQLDEFDLLNELAGHLADGEVAVLMESGSENLRYIAGSAFAVARGKEPVRISLDSIYELAARELQVPQHRIRRAEY
jgi:hypothetical protein